MRELLTSLCRIPAVSGREEGLREYIINQIADFCTVETDRNGNIICFKKGKKRALKKIMVDAHMDEVGIIAQAATSDGFIKFQTVGGIETAVMLCRGVIFENGTRGVVGMKPVHLSNADERKKYPPADSLYIDIGASSKEEAEKLVKSGDVAVFESKVTLLGNERIKARAIDDRAGVACLISLLKKEAEYDFYATFTVQEEVGCRGAQTAAFSLAPDAAIVIEATTAADIHGIAEEKQVCRLGMGPALSFMDKGTLYNRQIYDFAKNSGLICQTKEFVAGGNNARGISLSREGVPTAAISLPCRYIHSPSCVADLNDLDNMLPLAEAVLNKLCEGKLI